MQKAAPRRRGLFGFLTCAAAHAFGDDGAEVPEARLAAVALLPADARLTGALPAGRVAGALVGAVDVTLTRTCGKFNNICDS